LSVLVLHGNVLIVGRLQGWPLQEDTRSCLHVRCNWFQTAPMDPSLAKAEPSTDAGSASVIIYLRKGKNFCAAAVRERNEKM